MTKARGAPQTGKHVARKPGIDASADSRFFQTLAAAIDSRIVPCRVDVNRSVRRLKIAGFTMYPQTDAFVRRLARETFAGAEIEFDLRILRNDRPARFFETALTTASFFAEPRRTVRGLLTQALCGTVVRGFFEQDGFLFAQHADGYVGYVPLTDVREVSPAQYLRWRNGPFAVLRRRIRIGGTTAPAGARLACEGDVAHLAGGEYVRLRRGDAWFADPAAPGILRALRAHMRPFMAVPYVWGGTTRHGVDCSGFAQSVFLQQHTLLPRDANMQAYVGDLVGHMPDHSDLLPGDLVFFMNDNTRIYHVGIWVGAGRFVHASIREGITTTALYRHDHPTSMLARTFVFARRVYVEPCPTS